MWPQSVSQLRILSGPLIGIPSTQSRNQNWSRSCLTLGRILAHRSTFTTLEATINSTSLPQVARNFLVSTIDTATTKPLGRHSASSQKWHSDLRSPIGLMSRQTFPIHLHLVLSVFPLFQGNDATMNLNIGLTPRSTRTLPAPPSSTSHGSDFSSSLNILSPAGPVNCFR